MIQKITEKAQEIVHLIIVDYLKYSDSKHLNSDELRNIYGAILFKTIHSFEASLILVPNFEVKPFFQVAYGSILRDIISDLILAEYLSHKNADSNVDIKQVLDIVYADHDIFADKQKKLHKEMYGDTKGYEEYSKSLNNSVAKYKDEKGAVKKEYRLDLGVSAKVKYIYSRSTKERKNTIKDLYYWYNNFSKLAHFGKMTIPTISSTFVTNSPSNRNNYYRDIIETVLIFSIGLLEQLAPDNKVNIDIENKFRELCEVK